VKLLALRLGVFGVLIGLYVMSPWIGMTVLVSGFAFALGQVFFTGAQTAD
jgi:hypothetical protein